jgi:hypothetical protein
MTTSPRMQDTTPRAPVTLPSLPLDQYGALVARLQNEADDDATITRIARGADILIHQGIYETAELGIYRVESCQGDGPLYTTTSHACDCVDYQRRQQPCKHVWAIVILNEASAAASFERAQARYLLTARGLAATVAPVA